MIFQYEFEVRWSDIDANCHLANSAYMQCCAQTRMAFLNKKSIGLTQLNRWGVGAVMLHEQYSFFKEIFSDQSIYVTLELSGGSKDGKIHCFLHKFYLKDGTHCATSQATGVWIDIMLRKITIPPREIMVAFEDCKSTSFQQMSMEDIKNLPFKPENRVAFV